MSSDDTFLNFRRFARIGTRVLLVLQNDLQKLERELDELDKADEADPLLQHRLFGFENFRGYNDAHMKLLSAIQAKKKEYSRYCTYALHLRQHLH